MDSQGWPDGVCSQYGIVALEWWIQKVFSGGHILSPLHIFKYLKIKKKDKKKFRIGAHKQLVNRHFKNHPTKFSNRSVNGHSVWMETLCEKIFFEQFSTSFIFSDSIFMWTKKKKTHLYTCGRSLSNDLQREDTEQNHDA